MRVGVIGAGLMGATHARILSAGVPGAELVATADPVAPADLQGRPGADRVA